MYTPPRFLAPSTQLQRFRLPVAVEDCSDNRTASPSRRHNSPSRSETKPIKESASRRFSSPHGLLGVRGAGAVFRTPAFRRRETEHTFLSDNTLSLRNQSLVLVTLPQRCTLWTGGNPLWSLSEFGFVPHLAWRCRNATVRCRSPFPEPRRPWPPMGPFWLRSGRLPPAPSTTSSAIAWQSRPNTTTQAGASPLVVSDAAVAGYLQSPAPAPPAAVSN